jgi:hypothetical protein
VASDEAEHGHCHLIGGTFQPSRFCQ